MIQLTLNPVNTQPTPQIEVGEYGEPIVESWIAFLKQGGDVNTRVLGETLIIASFQALGWGYFNDDLEQFSILADLLLSKGGDPNSKLQRISINDDVFLDVNCVQILYIFWKSKKWNEAKEQIFENLFDRIIEDPRVDLKATFSEEYRAEGSYFSAVEFDHLYTFESSENLLEQANIFHFASMLGDIPTAIKLLNRDPQLLHSTCHLVRGKSMLNKPELIMLTRPIRANEHGLMALARCQKEEHIFQIERILGISAIHIAASKVHEAFCTFLMGRGLPPVIIDSYQQTPQKYLEGIWFTKDNRTSYVNLMKYLKHVPKIDRTLPTANCFIQRTNYTILYDTRMKVATYVYGRLTNEALEKNATRKNMGFTQDLEIPKLNRAKTDDYTHTGFQRGHLWPANDTTVNLQELKDTFKMTNVFPQNPGLNLGRWKQLENKVREWAKQYREVEVIIGPLFVATLYTDGKKRVCYEVIGEGNVAVPTHCFKVVRFHTTAGIEQRAYLFANQKPADDENLDHCLTTIEEIQKLSGIIFQK